MPDTKITALTAIGANPIIPATFPIPMVDLTDTSMAASGTTKKVTVNQILGAGGTATLASATITGDLTVDTSTLKVDSTNNRVGIGTASPGYPLHVSATDAEIVIQDSNTAVGSNPASLLSFWGSASRAGYIGYPSDNNLYITQVANSSILFLTNNTTQMTLNSTGLGVGDAPATNSRLTIGSTNATGFQYALRTTGITTGRSQIYLNNTSGDLVAGIEGSTAGASVTGSAAYSAYIGTATSNPFYLVTGGTVRATVDSTGNVGIGVTPSASWNAAFKALQIGSSNYFSIASQNTAASRGSLLWNAIGSGDEAFVYRSTGDAANRFMVGSGLFAWYTAAAGTAGNAITFTQAMTLDASGNLLVGTTSAGGNRLNVQTASGDCLMLVKSQAANTNLVIDYVSNYGNYTIRKSGTAVWDYGVISDSSATPTFKIQNASSVGVQLVSGATAWTTLSDETMKDIIEPISNAVSKVGSLRSVIGKFKTDDSSKRRSFLIAQDVQSVLPEAVDVIGENNELGLRYTEVIPLLVAAIKELTARVQTLETR